MAMAMGCFVGLILTKCPESAYPFGPSIYLPNLSEPDDVGRIVLDGPSPVLEAEPLRASPFEVLQNGTAELGGTEDVFLEIIIIEEVETEPMIEDDEGADRLQQMMSKDTEPQMLDGFHPGVFDNPFSAKFRFGMPSELEVLAAIEEAMLLEILTTPQIFIPDSFPVVEDPVPSAIHESDIEDFALSLMLANLAPMEHMPIIV